MKRIIVILFLLLAIPGHSSVDFDGTDDALDCATLTGRINDDNYTIYARWKEGGSTTEQSAINEGSTSSSQPLIKLQHRGDGADKIEYKHRGNANPIMAITSTNAFASQWVCVVGVRIDNDNIELFVNGASEGTYVELNMVAGTTTTLNIGRSEHSGAVQHFDGLISEAAVWSDVLTDHEISQLCTNAGVRIANQIRPDILLRYWQLNEDVDGTSADGFVFKDFANIGSNACTGNDGAGNANLTAKAEEVLSYP